MKFCQSLCLFGIVALSNHIQAADPTFEVASVKPSPQGVPLISAARFDAGRIVISNWTLKSLVVMAYATKEHLVFGGPNWIDSRQARCSIEAKTDGPVSKSQLSLMLQGLLADRFKLAVHHEKKELPVFALIVGKNGSKLREASGELKIDVTQTGRIERITAHSAPIDWLTSFLTSSIPEIVATGRPVIDKTGLLKSYDFVFDQIHPSQADVDTPSDPSGAPSIFTTIQSQLGLKLEPSKEWMDVLIVDYAEKPSQN